jgi:hypothetical protein
MRKKLIVSALCSPFAVLATFLVVNGEAFAPKHQ